MNKRISTDLRGVCGLAARNCGVVWVGIGLLWITGCSMRQDQPRFAPPPGQDTSTVKSIAGTIVKVNEELQHVIIKCNALPSEGEEVKVYREGRPVARLRISDSRLAPYVAADIIEGDPAVKDEIRR